MSEQGITRRRLAEASRPSGTDWERLARQSEQEIAAAVAGDPDAAPLVDEAWFRAAEVVEPPTKELISIRLDKDVLDFFRATSERYQTRINAVLRQYMLHERSKR